jgi:hypothetical protein
VPDTSSIPWNALTRLPWKCSLRQATPGTLAVTHIVEVLVQSSERLVAQFSNKFARFLHRAQSK